MESVACEEVKMVFEGFAKDLLIPTLISSSFQIQKLPQVLVSLSKNEMDRSKIS